MTVTTLRPLLLGIGAYAMWGLAPAYWKLFASIPAIELLAQRVIWSLMVALALLAATRRFAAYRTVLLTPRALIAMTLAALLLGVNWLVFVWAVVQGQILATSLGYYLNPLISVVLGLVVLRESLRPMQWLAVSLAAIGVAGYVISVGELPWVSVVLAATFGLYGLVRKTSPTLPIPGFAVEMSVLVLPAIAFIVLLSLDERIALASAPSGTGLALAASGLVTAAPLLCFNAAARDLDLSTLGILQYIAPSISLVLAILAYGETFTLAHAFTFGCVWTALLIFTTDSILRLRDRGRAAASIIR
jgi:chloramphenicol-sensitive protein RarD